MRYSCHAKMRTAIESSKRKESNTLILALETITVYFHERENHPQLSI